MRPLPAILCAAVALAVHGCHSEPPPPPQAPAAAQAVDDSIAASVPGLTTGELDAAADSMEAALEPAEHLSQ